MYESLKCLWIENECLEMEMLKIYDSKTEGINIVEKQYYLKAKDILTEYNLI